MSTSEQDKAGNTSLRLSEAVDAGAMPDIATLTEMANEFFRALPGQTFSPAPVQPAPDTFSRAAFSPDVRSSAPGLASAPNFDTLLPQFGGVAPAIPALPGVDKLPSEADAQRLAGSPAFVPGEIATVRPFAAAPVTELGFMQPGASQQQIATSPFSLPLPSFDAMFPSFEAGLPAISPMSALPTEDAVRAALTTASSFYFLEDAGALSKPGTETKASATTLRPSVLPDLQLPRQQFDVASVRRDFPILQERVHGRPLIWLDNAATTQKPQSVIDRISYFYEHENSNIHRAAHELAARATDAYEDARTKVAHFLNASSSKEIVFVRGATEAINLVAQSWGRRHIGKDDEIVITWIEHHANIVPWQMLCAEKGARLRVAPVDDDGQIILEEYEKLLGPRTRLVSITQVSNALGTITPAQQMVQMAHRYGARVLVDGAQAVSHMPIDVQSLGCDFYVFSGHKVFGPTGIGVLYGRPDVLVDTPPWQGGGNMIVDVTFEKTIYQAPPSRFEAGTGNIADAVGLGAAIDYLDQIGMERIARYEHELLVYATQGLLTIPGLRLIGTAKEKAGVLSFVLDGFRTEEVGTALNREGIAVRSGHHCAQPTLRRFGVETTVRPSLALYNSCEDIDALIAGLHRLKQFGA
jgi:cysteine desulfurase / selenocysteine lyase